MSNVHFTRFTDVIGYDVEASKYHQCFRSRAAVLQQPRYQYSAKVFFLHFLHVLRGINTHLQLIQIKLKMFCGCQPLVAPSLLCRHPF